MYASAAHAGARACGDPRRGGGKLYLIGMIEDVDSELLAALRPARKNKNAAKMLS